MEAVKDPPGTAAAEENGSGPAAEAQEALEQGLVIDGTGQLSMNVGGKRPTGSSLRLTGGKIDVEGQFAKGETVRISVVAVVNDVGFKDEEDSKTGQVVGCERRHKARILEMTVGD